MKGLLLINKMQLQILNHLNVLNGCLYGDIYKWAIPHKKA